MFLCTKPSTPGAAVQLDVGHVEQEVHLRVRVCKARVAKKRKQQQA